MIDLQNTSRRIVMIAVNKKPESKKVIQLYLDNMCDKDHDLVYLCHIYKAPSLSTYPLSSLKSIPWQKWEKKLSQRINEINTFMNEYQCMCDVKRVPSLVYITYGKRKKGLLELSKILKASMIFMGKKRGFFSKFFGGLPVGVAHNCRIPITIVV
ncbi:hypothetical protein RF11_15252 [Thelohanellus kitauei]|uniref:UspA domain-containing protein n=1 Tax=Thelohanellus kitauei TaxID=669202 RepID=A0A0C2MI60_THEKT|nr:hypothetical protein RF11_15252 [Thelohanellus kitauei]